MNAFVLHKTLLKENDQPFSAPNLMRPVEISSRTTSSYGTTLHR